MFQFYFCDNSILYNVYYNLKTIIYIHIYHFHLNNGQNLRANIHQRCKR